MLLTRQRAVDELLEVLDCRFPAKSRLRHIFTVPADRPVQMRSGQRHTRAGSLQAVP